MIRNAAVLTLLVCLLPATRADDLTKGSSSPETLMDAGHYKRARTLLEVRLRANPNDAYARFLESKVKESFGDLPGAIVSAERAVALEPHNVDFHAQLAEVYAYTADESSWVRGLHFVRLMKREISAALSMQPKHTDTLLVSMMFSYKAPRLAGGDKRRALAIANDMEHDDPRWGYLAEARVLEDSGEDARLETLLKKAVQTDPSHYRALYELSRFYCCIAAHKDFAAVERVSSEAIKLDPGRAGAYDMLARAYAAGRRWTELESILAQSERMVPDDLAPYYQAANILAGNGVEPARAATLLRKYLGQAAEGREPTRAQAQALLSSVNKSASATR
jgi:tetratricopeptide (TPR) repeat protein